LEGQFCHNTLRIIGSEDENPVEAAFFLTVGCDRVGTRAQFNHFLTKGIKIK
jgi:hypothetical protein